MLISSPARWRAQRLALVAGVSAVAHALSEAPPPGPDRSTALVTQLRARGLLVEPESIHWVDPAPSPWEFLKRKDAWVWLSARAANPGGQPNGLRDVFLARTRLTPEGQLFRIGSVHNLTETRAADESELTVRGAHAAWLIGSAEKKLTLQLADLGGTPPPPEWPRVARWQQVLTNWQETGRPLGVSRRSFRLEPPARKVEIVPREGQLDVRADGNRIAIPLEGGAPTEGGHLVRELSAPAALPGNLVTWAVDRARGLTWFGDERMQIVKAVAYAGFDFLQRRMPSAWLDPGADDIAEDFGESAASLPLFASADPKHDWPPPALELVLPAAFEGEGKWRSLEGDDFVLSNPGLPDAVVTTFLRTDEERTFSQIYIAAWDPRQVELHVMTGTEEPKSATGETGTGLIPREPAVITRIVAAFNGGFQTSHGNFGIQADGTLFVPPVEYAATVGRLPDGSTGFGTWPEKNAEDLGWLDFRQNLTPLIADGRVNPYHRVWWGGVPHGWEDDTRTVRSGLCLTTRGHIVYFYGSAVDHQHLARAMERAACDYGLHLDMNQGHTGLEFFRVAAAAELPLLSQKLDPVWQEQGDVPEMPGYRFRGRRLIRSMRLMHFPRYIKRQTRDFFYLTLRHLLPGAPLTDSTLPAAPNAGGRAESKAEAWVVDGLPQHGFPYAIATAERLPVPARANTKLRLAKLDPKFLRGSTSIDGPLVASVPLMEAGPKNLWLADGRVLTNPPEGGPSTLLAAASSGATAAFGAGAPDGMLYYAEVVTGRDAARDPELLSAILSRAGCTQIVYAEAGALSLAGTTDLSGHPTTPRRSAYLIRTTGPAARRVFPGTPIVPPTTWQPLQNRARALAAD